jgi:hypothetical protein
LLISTCFLSEGHQSEIETGFGKVCVGNWKVNRAAEKTSCDLGFIGQFSSYITTVLTGICKRVAENVQVRNLDLRMGIGPEAGWI